jgi:arsenate reductase (thioredoxin)
MASTVAAPAPLAGVEALPAELARALGDPLRWRIVELLSTEQLCVAHLAEELAIGQPLVSHHLKVLRQAGLIEPDRYRYWTYYRLRPGALVRLAATLGLVARSAPSGTACRRLIPGADPSMPAQPPARQGATVIRDGQLDPTSRATFARSIEALHEEFRGVYSLETIERFVDESIDRMAGARVVDFIPLFVHRFARERLRALAQSQGALMKDVPEVLFVCVHNAGRSQMAAALLDHHAKGKVHVRSAGSGAR